MVEKDKAEILNQKIAERAILLWRYKTDGIINNAAVSADGEYIAARGDDKSVFLFNKDGELLWSYKVRDDVDDVAISSDGSNIVALSYDNRVYLFNRGGELLWSYEPGGGDIFDVTISSDGSKITMTDSETVYFLNRDNKLHGTYRTDSSIIDFSVSSDGSHIAAGCSDKKVIFFNRDGELLWEHKISGWLTDVKCVSVSPDGSYVAAGAGKKVYFFDRGEGFLWDYATGGFLDVNKEVRLIYVTSEGSNVVAVIGDATKGDYRKVIYLNREGRQLRTYNINKSTKESTKDVSFFPDGSNIAVRYWHAVHFLNRAGKPIWKYKSRLIQDVSVSPDGSYVAVVARGSLYFFTYGAVRSDALEEERVESPAYTPPKPEFKQYITEKETVTTKERKIPVFISKTLPSKCPACGASFKGGSGDVCEYCGAVIREEEKMRKLE